MELGTYIQQLRKEQGLSQEALAERMGVSRQAVSKWEQGLSYPSTENLLALAQLFGVSADGLIGLARETPEEPAPEQPSAAPAPQGGRKGLSPLWLIPLAALCLAVGWALPRPAAQAPDPAPPASSGAEPSPVQTPELRRPGREETGDFSLLRLTESGWEFLLPGQQQEDFPFSTSLLPTAMETVRKTDFRHWKLHNVPCGEITLNYSTVPDGSYLDRATTIVPGWETPRGIAVGSTEQELMEQYGDELIYLVKESGQDILCRHDYIYVYTTLDDEAYAPDATVGAALIFYMKTGLVAGIELRAYDDAGSNAWAVTNVYSFPVKNGKPDFSLRKEPETEPIDSVKAIYIALYALTNDRNLSEEETYQHRLALFGNLPKIDWLDYNNFSESFKRIEELLEWIWDQEFISPEERAGLIPGLENLLATEDISDADNLMWQAQRILDEQYEYAQQ